MSLTQGSPLPNITTTQGTTTTAPSWYTQYLSDLSTQGINAGNQAQYVGATDLQQQAFNQAQANVGNYIPALQGAANLVGQSGNTNIAQSAQNFMTPYTQDVVGAMNQLGIQNLQQNVLPGAQAAAAGTGQFGSTRGLTAAGQQLNAGLANLNANEAQALQTGYTQALQGAEYQAQNQLAAGQQLGNIANQTQALGLGDVNALSTLGAQQQQIAQNQSLFPLTVEQQQANIMKGFTIPTSTTSTYTGPIPGAYSASPLAQIAGLGSILGQVSTTPLGQSLLGGLTTGVNNLLGAVGSAGTAAGNAVGDIFAPSTDNTPAPIPGTPTDTTQYPTDLLGTQTSDQSADTSIYTPIDTTVYAPDYSS